jgi:hypothetical protein
MKTIQQIYEGFVTLTTNRKEGTYTVATYRDLTPGATIEDAFGYKMSVSEVLDSWPSKGNFHETPPTVYKVKAKITKRPEKEDGK